MREPAIAAIIARAGVHNDERRSAVRTLCAARVDQYMTALEKAATWRGERVWHKFRDIARERTGPLTRKIFSIINRVVSGATQTAGKLAELYQDDDKHRGEIIRGAQAVRDEACRLGARIHAASTSYPDVMLEVMRKVGRPVAARHEGLGLAEACTFANFKAALARSQVRTGVGVDGWNSYLLRYDTEEAQRQYWEQLCIAIARSEYPPEWKQWVAMLHMKPGEDPRELGRRRDIWVTCHGQKLVMRMINKEYERVSNAVTPGLQAGYAIGRNAKENVLVLRLAQQQAAATQSMLCIGWQDMGSFFMSCCYEVLWAAEARTGVDPSITRVVQALHDSVTGRYETEWGLTEGFAIGKGTGQGCVNGAVRSKLLLNVMQGAVDRLCKGHQVVGGRGVGQMYFADDGAYLADTPGALQQMYDVAWVMAKVCGLRLIVKGKKKTAYVATYWEGGQQHDVTDWQLRFPDGQVIPQIMCNTEQAAAPTYTASTARRAREAKAAAALSGEAATVTKVGSDDVHTYRYLGAEMTARWQGGMNVTRQEIRMRVIHVIKAIGRIQHLTHEQLRGIIDIAIEGIIGYYARGTPLTKADCDAIETARAEAIRVRGYTTGAPKAQLYEAQEQGGMGHTHAYSMAAAALFDQIDRALSANEGEPHRHAVEAQIAETCWRLGCRRIHPLEWHPTHIEHELSEDNIIEAWILTKLRMRKRGVRTGTRLDGALSDERWQERRSEVIRNGPRLWEAASDLEREIWGAVPVHEFRGVLARAGVATWGDITNMCSGAWLTWREVCERHGLRVTRTGERAAYEEMVRQMEARSRTSAVTQWQEYVTQRWRTTVQVHGSDAAKMAYAKEPNTRGDGKGDIVEVIAAKAAPACMGGWEYLVRDGEGRRVWRPRSEVDAIIQDSIASVQQAETARDAAWPVSLWERIERGVTSLDGGERATAQRARRATGSSPATADDIRALVTLLYQQVDIGLGTAEEVRRHNVPTYTADSGARYARWKSDPAVTTYIGEPNPEYTTNPQEQINGGPRAAEKTIMGLTPYVAQQAMAVPTRGGVRVDMLERVDQAERWWREEMAAEIAAEEIIGGSASGLISRGDSSGLANIDDKPVTYMERVAIRMRAADKDDEWQPGRAFWRAGGNASGTTEIGSSEIADDPVMNLVQRCDELESDTFIGYRPVRARRGGLKIICDEAEQKALRERGDRETWHARRILMALHAAHEFTHAACTDGSLIPARRGRARRVAYGVWEGMASRKHVGHDERATANVAAGERESGEQLLARVGQGLWGGRLPDEWEVFDAEMYAILAYLRHTANVGDDAASQRRCLVVSDCQSVLQEIEHAWRDERAGRRRDRSVMMDEICYHRRRLGLVVTVWVPSHRGIAMNAYADAAAKAYA
jgi:hypothetical protein